MSETGDIAVSSERGKQIPPPAISMNPEKIIFEEAKKEVEEQQTVTAGNFIPILRTEPITVLIEEHKEIEQLPKEESQQNQGYKRVSINVESHVIEEVKEEPGSSHSSVVELDIDVIKKRETRKSVIKFCIGTVILLILFLWYFVIFVILGFQFS